MALPTRGQRDWDDELNNEIQRLDAAVQSAVADASAAKSSAAYSADAAEQSRQAAEVAESTAVAPSAEALASVDADENSQFRQQQDARHEAAYADRALVDSGRLSEAGLSATIASETTNGLPDFYADSRLSYIAGRGAFMPLRKFLDGEVGHATVQVLGDSTAGLDGNWVRRVAEWAAAQDPAIRVRYRGLDPDGNYTAPEMIQGGTKGTHHVAFSDVDYSYAYPTNAGTFTEDLDLAVKIQPTAWPVAAQGTLVARMGSAAPDFGWALYAMPDGKLKFQWSVDGTGLTSVDSPVLDLGVTDYTWVRVHANVTGSDATVSFFTGSDGHNWTAVGTAITNVGWGPISQPATVKTSVGAWAISGVGSARFVGKISEAWIRDGAGGPTIADTQATDWAVASGATFSPGWFLDVVNGGWQSRNLNDLTVNGETLQPHMGAILTILCSGHNDGDWSGSYYAGLLNSWRDGVLERSPNTSLVVTAQNPRVPPADKIDSHAARHSLLAGWANRNGAGLLDVYNLFRDDSRYDGTASSALYNADAGGVHPSPTGWQLWADLVTEAVRMGA